MQFSGFDGGHRLPPWRDSIVRLQSFGAFWPKDLAIGQLESSKSGLIHESGGDERRFAVQQRQSLSSVLNVLPLSVRMVAIIAPNGVSAL